MINTGGGTYDPSEPCCYFVASNLSNIQKAAPYHNNLLIAVNELNLGGIEQIKTLSSNGAKVFLDSGIFNLTNEHKRAHGCTMDEALSLAPDQIDGFDKLWDKYLTIVRELEKYLWGYIELDQGGAVNKRKTRGKLERLGLRPIPVYHPLNDGWEYFDELASQYDRICIGNIVQADARTRERLVATVYERKKQYPHLWIHLLGFTPNEITSSYPPNSCDSSSWLTAVRWTESSCSKALTMRFAKNSNGLAYRYGSKQPELDSDTRATANQAVEASFLQMNWRVLLQEAAGEGLW